MKPNIGFCIDCTDGIEKPLIKKRCNTHYWANNAKENAAKKAAKIESGEIIEPPKENKPIAKVSKSMKVKNLQYSVLRIEFLGKKENRICPITKKPTTDIHHKKGRVGDLYLDTRYWVALSREGHKFVEENPEWAKENGFSLSRLAKD